MIEFSLVQYQKRRPAVENDYMMGALELRELFTSSIWVVLEGRLRASLCMLSDGIKCMTSGSTLFCILNAGYSLVNEKSELLDQETCFADLRVGSVHLYWMIRVVAQANVAQKKTET